MNNQIETKEKELRERIQFMYPTDEDKIDGLLTMLGMSAALTRFISVAFSPEEIKILPIDVHYSLAITSSNMVTLLSSHPEEVFEKIKFPTQHQVLDEQREEALRRRLIYVVESMYEWLQEEKKDG